jgi:hypothetical protein
VGKKISAVAALFAGGALVIGGLLTAGPVSAASEKAEARPQACNLSLDTGRVDCFPLGTNVNKELERLYGKPVVTGANAEEYKKNFDAAQQQMSTTTMSVDGGASTQSLTIVLGTIYDDLNYGDGQLSITGATNSGASCGGTSWTLHNLGQYGWSGRVSSTSAASGCLMTAREGTIAGNGASVSTWGGLGYVGDALNDRTNSLSWRP